MALPILDGNQTAATLSTIITGGAHIPAHTVVSLGSQAISDITSGVSGSVVSISNFPASQATTFGAVTGSVSVLNFPASQSVTFTQASVTFGATTGSVSVLNFPSTQTIAGTVTANVGGIASGVTIPVRLFAEAEGGSSSGQDTLLNCDSNGQLLVNLKSGGASALGYDGNAFVQVKQVSGSSVTIGSLPAISGTVTANVTNSVTVGAIIGPAGGSCLKSISATGDAVRVVLAVRDTNNQTVEIQGSGGGQYNIPIYGTVTIGSLPAISGTVTANVFGSGYLDQPYAVPVMTDGGDVVTRGLNIGFHEDLTANEFRTVKASEPFPVQIRKGTVTIGSLPAISGTVTVGNIPVVDNNTGGSITSGVPIAFYDSFSDSQYVIASDHPLPVDLPNCTQNNNDGIPSRGVLIGWADTNEGSFFQVSDVKPLPISGTVTVGALPSGALTTRFGSVVTANTAEISNAVTNTGRKYLLIQNVTTSSNAITIGVGFVPTTTQGIQLSAGAGITFESSYIPTGAVYVLSSVTASPFTIIEA